MQRRVPVVEVVARREAGDPCRGGERDRGRELDLRRSCAERVEQLLDELGSLVLEQRVTSASRPFQVPRSGSRGQCLREPRECALEQRGEVDRVAPRVRLLHPLGEGELRGERPEHRLGALPAGDVQRLERLVHEVERVAAVEVAVVGGSGEEHVRELGRRRAGADGRDERALGALRVADLDEAAEPVGEPCRLGRLAWQRVEREARRPGRGV